MPEARIFASIEEFRRANADAATPVEGRVRASFDTEVKAGEGTRTLNFTISTASVDRYGDTIAVDGWKLDAYRKNSVVLWAHDSTMLPVAKANQVWTENQALKAVAEFTPVGMARFNDTVFDMYKAGFLSATSVGFLPLKYAFVDDPARRYGIDFLEQELLEFSCVPVPANAEALIEARAAGVDMGPMLDWAEGELRASGDAARIVRLAESVLGSAGRDPVALDWAGRIAASAGMAIIPRERIERIERAAKQKRLAERRTRELDLIRARAQ